MENLPRPAQGAVLRALVFLKNAVEVFSPFVDNPSCPHRRWKTKWNMLKTPLKVWKTRFFACFWNFLAKRPRRAPPARHPGNPDFSATQRTKPRVLKTLLKTSQNFPPRFPLIFPSPAPKVLHKNPVTGKGPIKRMQRSGAGRCGISRGVSGAGRPARPIKKNST